MKKLLTLTVLIGSVLSVSSALSQTHYRGLQCVKDYYGVRDSSNNDPDLVEVRFSPDLATQLLQDIVARSNMQLNPSAVDCDHIANATAFQPEDNDGLPDSLRSRHFIIYNSLWVREVLGESRDRAIFLLGHELGHISRHHLTSRKTISDLEKESEADFEGACAVARLGGEWAVVEELISRLRGEVDTDYPSAKTSMRLARAAFRECGGNHEQKVNYPDTKII